MESWKCLATFICVCFALAWLVRCRHYFLPHKKKEVDDAQDKKKEVDDAQEVQPRFDRSQSPDYFCHLQ
jgi:hypothetical protein